MVEQDHWTVGANKAITGHRTVTGTKLAEIPYERTEGCHGIVDSHRKQDSQNRTHRTGPFDWTEGCHMTGEKDREEKRRQHTELVDRTT